MIERIVQTTVDEADQEEQRLENNLRPKDFANYIGQERLKKEHPAGYSSRQKA